MLFKILLLLLLIAPLAAASELYLESRLSSNFLIDRLFFFRVEFARRFHHVDVPSSLFRWPSPNSL